MKDRGRPLKSVPCFDLTTALSGFSKILLVAMFLCSCLPHGDVLPHNIVYDEENKELVLIDIDDNKCALSLRKLFDNIKDSSVERVIIYLEGDETEKLFAGAYGLVGVARRLVERV